MLEYREALELFRYDYETGVTGVYFSKTKKKYIAQIKVNRETIYLGIFDTLEGEKASR